MNATNKHTAGPWVIDGQSVVSHHGGTIASNVTDGPEHADRWERAANLRLIAAAPALLAALDHAADLLRAYGMDLPNVITKALADARGAS